MEHGQGLVVIEAMKMQNEMKSPKAGHGRLAHGDRRRGGCRGPSSGGGGVEGYGRRALSEVRRLDLDRDRA